MRDEDNIAGFAFAAWLVLALAALIALTTNTRRIAEALETLNERAAPAEETK